MSEPPVELYEGWSPTGERMARRAHWGAVICGLLFFADVAILAFGVVSERLLGMIPCLFLFLMLVFGGALIGRGVQIQKRQRGSTIAVMVLALILSLVVSMLIGLVLYNMWNFGFPARVDMLAWAVLILQVCVCASGYYATWYCIQTLRHWPPRAGAAFQVELISPPDHEIKA